MMKLEISLHIPYCIAKSLKMKFCSNNAFVTLIFAPSKYQFRVWVSLDLIFIIFLNRFSLISFISSTTVYCTPIRLSKKVFPE